jgi:hypothetical protein
MLTNIADMKGKTVIFLTNSEQAFKVADTQKKKKHKLSKIVRLLTICY